jgi:hypothetical protein
MTMKNTLLPVLAAAAALPVAGQGILPPGCVIPVHTGEPGYGVWAGGVTYKASFHDGFAFVPVVGAQPDATVRMRVQGVRVGGAVVHAPFSRVEPRWSYRRVEFRHGSGVVEAYDVRADGVEQTFAFPAPLGDGDLAVTLAVESVLRAQARGPAHADVVFADHEGRGIVRYGAAFAIDAAGRTLPIATTVQASTLELVVPGDWLASARYPVIIDPLLTRERIAHWTLSYGLVEQVDVARDPSRDAAVVAFDRQVSANDRDVWVVRTDGRLSATGARVVFSDLATGWRSLRPSVAYVRSQDRWIVAFTRIDPLGVLTYASVRFHVHAGADASLRTDTIAVPKPSPDAWQDSDVDVGGSYSNSSPGTALLVFRRNHEGAYGAGTYSDVYCATVEVETGAVGPARRVAPTGSGTTFDRERPCVNQVAYGSADGWMVVFQEWNTTVTSNEDWDLNGYRVDASGVSQATGAYTASRRTATHQLQPIVEGCHNGNSVLGPRYVVGYATMPVATWPGKRSERHGEAIVVERVTWPLATGYTRGTAQELRRTIEPTLMLTGLAYDRDTASHFGATFFHVPTGRLHVSVLGYDLGIVEEQIAYTPVQAYASTAAITYGGGEYQLAYAAEEQLGAGDPVYGQVMLYRNQLEPVEYGTGCTSARLLAEGVNMSGSEFGRVRLAGAQAGVPAVVMLSTRRGSVPLDALGMTGCTLLLDLGSMVLQIGATTNAIGSLSLPLAYPTRPIRFAGTLDWQAAFLAPAANSLGVVTTAGLEVVIR